MVLFLRNTDTFAEHEWQHRDDEPIEDEVGEESDNDGENDEQGACAPSKAYGGVRRKHDAAI